MASFNPSTDPSTEVLQHGMALDLEYKQVQCCYCGGTVPGFDPLQKHLAGIASDVAECPDPAVPENVRDYFRTYVLAREASRKGKEKVTFHGSGSCSGGQCTANEGLEMNPVQLLDSPPPRAEPFTDDWLRGLRNYDFAALAARHQNTGKSTKSVESEIGQIRALSSLLVDLLESSGWSSDLIVGSSSRPEPQPGVPADLQGHLSVTDLRTGNTGKSTNLQAIDLSPLNDGETTIDLPTGVITMDFSVSDAENAGTDRSTGVEAVNNSASKAHKRRIGRHVYLNALDASAVTSFCFKNIISGFFNRDVSSNDFPSIVELNGWILEDELKEMHDYVNKIRMSWDETGCSILLDGWIDQSGRDLIHVLVDCSAGPIYLGSADVSLSKGVDALLILLESVIAEVGAKNIIQIVAHTTSERLDVVRHKLAERYSSVFWTVSGTRCLSMILEKIAEESDLVKPTLDVSKRIMRFIHNNDEALALLKSNIDGDDLVTPSKIKAATPFLTLERFLFKQEKLTKMCTSSEWLGSRWGSSKEGRTITCLVSDDNFWRSVETVVKLSIPLVKTIALINGKGEPSIGFIYETMDQIKETIRLELGRNNPTYKTWWQMIDQIWNGVLHSTIHATAHFLNPKYFFPNDLESDPEIIFDILAIVRMTNDCCGPEEVCREINFYRKNRAGFGAGLQEIHDISPAEWWARHGGPCPVLQKVAIRLLSQKCIGADSYELRRDVAEKLLSDTRKNRIEQQKMLNFSYLHYNMKLQQFKNGPKFDILADTIDPSDDWIVDEMQQAEAVAPPVFGSRPHLGRGSGSGSGVSESRPSLRRGSGSGRSKLRRGGSSSGPSRKNPKRKE